MTEYSPSFNPVSRDPDEPYYYAMITSNTAGYGLDIEKSGLHEAKHFSITDQYTQLSPDEAWVVKHFLSGVDEQSDYGKLRDFIDKHFVSGVYENTEFIRISHESGSVLAGVYMGIYWELKDNDREKAENVKQRIDAILEYQPEATKQKFRHFYIGPMDDPKNN